MYSGIVSIAATTILNKRAPKTNGKNWSMVKTLAKTKIPITVHESIVWEGIVEKLFLIHKYLPFVILFQKWKIFTSIYCAIR